MPSLTRYRMFALCLAILGIVLVVGSGAGQAEQPAAAAARGADLAGFGAPARGVPGPDAPGSFNATLPNGRRVTPAGVSVQVGQNPLNSVLTPDGRYLITSNDDERNAPPRTGTSVDPADTKNGADTAVSQYSLAVLDTATMRLVAAVPVPRRAAPANPGSTAGGRTDSDATNGLFLGLAVLPTATGYTLYAAGGVADVVYKFTLDGGGRPTGAPVQIPVPVPTDKTQATYGMAAPGWLLLSGDATTLFVVNNNGNSVTPIALATDTPGTPVPVGFFPYAAAQYGRKLFVSNWGVTTRTFADGAGTTDPATGLVSHAGTPFIGGGQANRFANPDTDPRRSSSLSVLDMGGGAAGSISLARPIDGVQIVGGTHPSALALADRGADSALYVADANEDSIAIVDPARERLVGKVRLPSVGGVDPSVPGLTPDALALSPDQRTLYVAEAGVDSLAVYDVSRPRQPRFRGRIPTGWYPTAVSVSADGNTLYVTNAKGAGSPYGYQGTFAAAGVYTNPDVNWMFGSVQGIDLRSVDLAAATRQVSANTVVRRPVDGRTLATLRRNVRHVVFILRENKSYDTYLGDDATLAARGADGSPAHAQFGPYVPNTKALAEQFAVGDNTYADAEESNAGHSFALAATSTDYQQKTQLSRFNRPLVNVKNEDPEDYPLRGYIFNALAREGRSFRDYGDSIRVSGYDEGSSGNYCADDPKPGCANATYATIADTTSPTTGLGGLYTTTLPTLAVLAGHLDERYPGWNLRISDQRRAAEFIADYGALIAAGQAPEFTLLWLPGDHTGSCSTGTTPCGPQQEVADNDAALGQVVDYLTHAPTWKNTAIFVTEDDAQSSPDHVSAHRTYTMVVSPWAKRGSVQHALGSTVSVPKTIEEILGLPAMNLGDLVANDLLSYFTTTPDFTPFTTGTPMGTQSSARLAALGAPPETQRIWDLSAGLATDTYDADTGRLGQLTRVYFESLRLAARGGTGGAPDYARRQDDLYAQAVRIVS